MPNNIVDTYLQHVHNATKQYGEKSIVFLECGSFYEIYDVVPTHQSKHLQCCETILGILVTRKNKSDPNSPYMAGIPTPHIRRYNKMLMQHNYTIVFVGQKGEVPNITREVVQVLSPGCNLSEDVHDSTDVGQSVLMTLCIEEDDDGDCYAHIATFDTNCGSTHVESIVCDEDTLHMETILATTQDTLHTFLFHELCIYTHHVSERSKQLVYSFGDRWKDMGKLVHHMCIQELHLDYMFQRSFQEQFLERVFSNHVSTFQSIWESLSLQFTEASCVGTLVLLLQWIKQHDSRLVQSLQKPKSHQSGILYNSNATANTTDHLEHMVCYNELYAKLDIFDDTLHTTLQNNTSRSLFAILNKTRTKMGERLLQQRLKRVIWNKQCIEQRYDKVNALLNDSQTVGNDTYEVLEHHLKCIDLERMYRRFSLGQLQPKDIPRILNSQTNVIVILKHIVSLPSDNVLHAYLKEKQVNIQQFEKYQNDLCERFDEDKCTNVNLANLNDTLFRKGQYPIIDNHIAHLHALKHSVDDLAQVLMQCVPDMKLSGKQTSWIHVKHNDKEGHWLDISKNRFKVLKETLDKMTSAEKRKRIATQVGMIGHDFSKEELSLDDLEFNTKNKSNVKISSSKLRTLSFDIQNKQQHIIQLVRKEYTALLIDLYNKHYQTTIQPIVEYIAMLDVAFSTAHNAIHNGYVCPQIVEEKHSSLRATQLRHPLIEYLLQKSDKHDPYVPNDVDISHQSCLLLHGVNSVGKSSLLKSIAIAVIMAQAGLFVSASSFVLAPYHTLFARTGNDDNIHIAHSSFVKEMTETRCIIEHADQYSLVIADELCASTELDSAVHIVGGLLQLLSQRQVSFAFATHLFALQEHPFVSQLVERGVLKNVHLKVRFENDCLLFDRVLSEGLPTNRAYGVLVADKVIQNKAFTDILIGAQQVFTNHTSTTQPNSNCILHSFPLGGAQCTHIESSKRKTISPYSVLNTHDTHRQNTHTHTTHKHHTYKHHTQVHSRYRAQHTDRSLDDNSCNLKHRAPKPSKYNTSLWMEECAICKYSPQSNYDMPLDTHHIVEQQFANAQTGMIQHRFHKNNKHNLVALCKQCHQKIDTGELIIKGYVSSTRGAQLDWLTSAS